MSRHFSNSQNDQSHLAIKANLGEERGGGGGPLSCRAVLNHGSGLQGEYKKNSLEENGYERVPL